MGQVQARSMIKPAVHGDELDTAQLAAIEFMRQVFNLHGIVLMWVVSAGNDTPEPEGYWDRWVKEKFNLDTRDPWYSWVEIQAPESLWDVVAYDAFQQFGQSFTIRHDAVSSITIYCHPESEHWESEGARFAPVDIVHLDGPRYPEEK